MMRGIILSLALALLAGGAQAGITEAQVLTMFQQKGYTEIEVKPLGNTIKVQARQGNMQIEVTYDVATGQIVKQESHAIRGAASSNGSDDSATHDMNDDHGQGVEPGDDHGNDGAEAGDDNGGSGTEAGDDKGGRSGGRSGSGHDNSGRHDRSDD